MGQIKRKMNALCSKENMRVIKGVVRLVVVGYIVNHYRLRFIKEWFPFGG
jgi:hypothetical protein